MSFLGLWLVSCYFLLLSLAEKKTRNVEPKMLLAIFIRLVELAEIVSNCINLFAHIANWPHFLHTIVNHKLTIIFTDILVVFFFHGKISNLIVLSADYAIGLTRTQR